ncbi:MAG: flippase [Archaeoglobaceae archaeon]|nr:flippase [Archaeoglobaceae archaeon]MCX8152506.1 flippase [Archaeoglobaceae archaeon]MDW8013616.1 flippase [Archaeoglobaceae archaeon]
MLAKKVAANSIYNSSSILIANISGLIVIIYLAKVLRPESFGVFSLTMAISHLVLSLTDLGINQTATRFIAETYSKENFKLLRGYIKSLSRAKIFLSATVSIFLFAFSDFFSSLFNLEPVLLKVASIFIFFTSISSFILSIFNAFNDFQANFTKSISYEISRLLLLFFATSAVLAIFIHFLASLVSTLVLFYLILKKDFLFGPIEKVDFRRIYRFASYLTLGSISWTVFAYVDSLMIAFFLPLENVGYYRVAYSVVSAISGIMFIPAVLFPVFVQLEGEDLKRAFKRSFKYSALLAFPSALGLISISDQLIFYVFGKDYEDSIQPLNILSILIIISTLNFWGSIFNAKEMPEYPVYVTFFAMIVNVVLNYIMIPLYGTNGAAIATVLSNLFSWILLAYLSKRIFGVFFELEHVLKPLTASILMFLVLKYLSFGLLLTIVFGILTYFSIILAIKGLRKEDYLFMKVVFSR